MSCQIKIFHSWSISHNICSFYFLGMLFGEFCQHLICSQSQFLSFGEILINTHAVSSLFFQFVFNFVIFVCCVMLVPMCHSACRSQRTMLGSILSFAYILVVSVTELRSSDMTDMTGASSLNRAFLDDCFPSLLQLSALLAI